MEGAVFNIQKFSIHDGPGIRTTVFLKGCPLRCQWCHNPESNRPEPELMLYPHLCTGCGACVAACPSGCIRLEGETSVTDRSACVRCGACTSVCRAGAREMAGHSQTAEEVIREAAKDWRFYRTSGGGVTFSGGEPLMQAAFVAEMIREAKKKELHLAMETTGYARWEQAKPVFKELDLILYDLKEMDAQRHRELTGVSNERILDNLRRVADELSVPFWVRMPLIADVNDSLEEMKERAAFLQSLSRRPERIYLLPYHDLGLSKLKSLDWPTDIMEAFRTPEPEHLEACKAILEEQGFAVWIG